MFIGLLVLLVGVFVSPAMWVAGAVVFVVGTVTLWMLGITPAGRRHAARNELALAEHVQERADGAARSVQEQRDAAAAEQARRGEEAAGVLQRAVDGLLKELPVRGTSQQEAIAWCLSRVHLANDPRLRAEAERLARRHIAVDERLLCIAQSEGERRRPALLILTDRGAAIADQGLSYRYEPQPRDIFKAPEAGWGHLRAGALVFSFSCNPQLRIALAAREKAARALPTAGAADRPEERLIRTARDAELAAVDWMRYLGFADAVATAVGADEGIDVLAEQAVAQVKKEGSPTSRPTVQQLHGVAAAQSKAALFFSMAGYTPQAMDWASRHGIALFQYDLQGTPSPHNLPAHHLMQQAATLAAPIRTPRRNASRPLHTDHCPAHAALREEDVSRQAERAGLRPESLQDIANEVITEQRATMVWLQERFFLTRPQTRKALDALEQLGLVSPPAANGRRTVTVGCRASCPRARP
ncbi:hypothetical protein AQJ84_40185 [Streptomyces resistomycificus]|nr:hypothetical protein AQJ84_40185 [Streptomyces resistomycificus]